MSSVENIDFTSIANLPGREQIVQSVKQLIRQANYLDVKEKQQLICCCFFAATAHRKQTRASGSPYICHPIKVAEILASEVLFDLAVLQAAILHDVIEDTPVEKTSIVKLFSQEVANLVDGVSKLEKNKDLSAEEIQARTFEKLALAMRADPRVVMIKLADRMHNMQTLGALREDKRVRISKETLDVYIPIAKRLGMYGFKVTLEELAFKQLYPWRYKIIKKLLVDNSKRQALQKSIANHLNNCFSQQSIEVSIQKRTRNLYDIFKKLKKSRLNRKQIERASIPFILITNSVEDCYKVLWQIHQNYTPILNSLVDYIASPKSNGYQSIHTSLLTDERIIANFQIRTKEMHEIAQSGIIAILKYQNTKNKVMRAKEVYNSSIKRWFKGIENLSSLAISSLEYYKSVKQDLIGFDIQVLTPKGEPIALPGGSTVVDFAYQIHSTVGNRMASAEVNGVKVSFDYVLNDGQTVEILTNDKARPCCSWLFSAKTARVRTAIRHYIRTLSREEVQKIGFECFKRFLSINKVGYHANLIDCLEEVAEKKYHSSYEKLLEKIALFEVDYEELLNNLKEFENKLGVNCLLEVNMINKPGALGIVSQYLGRHSVNILKVDFLTDPKLTEITITMYLHSESINEIKKALKEFSESPYFINIQKEEYTL